MNAIILSVGDELVLGQTVDTNSAWLDQQLAAVGCDVIEHHIVGDDQADIAEAIRGALHRVDFLIISGGLGPTADDLTRQGLAQVLGVALELHEPSLAHLREYFRRINRPMAATNEIQAMFPRGTTPIENTAGTAPGIQAAVTDPARGEAPPGMKIHWRAGRHPRKTTRIFVMPGVPKEMKIMFAHDVLPHIQQAGGGEGGAVILSRTLHTFGLGESSIAEKLGDLMKRDRNPSVGTTVSQGIVSLRINSRFHSREEAQKQLDATSDACRAALADLIFGSDHQSLQSVVAELLNRRSEFESRKSLTVTTAESCTGGLLAKMLTDIPGSSDYFKQGWVTYSNQAKTERLGVSDNLLHVYGAVSEPVVEAMAKSARRLAKSDFALAVSGIAGPGGGTEKKPVGTVCIALAHDDAVLARTFHFTGDREMIRDRAAKMALAMLRFHLLGKPLPF